MQPTTVGRILVIDDDVLLGSGLCRLLKGHRVTAVSSAREGLPQVTGAERFDVILCDLMMPGMTGMEFWECLSSIDRSLADRVIFLTGGTYTEEARAFLEAVPNSRVEKPFDPRALKDLVDALVPAGVPET